MAKKEIDFCDNESVLNGMARCLPIPRPPIPPLPLVLLPLAKNRPGLSKAKTTASILARRSEAGINPLSPEFQKFIRIMVEEIFEAIQQDAKLSLAVNPGVAVIANGANSGGPVVCVGSTTGIGDATGVIT